MSETSKRRVDGPVESDAEPAPADALAHTVLDTGDDPVECTVYPRDCEDEALMTHWLTAREDVFVSLDEMR